MLNLLKVVSLLMVLNTAFASDGLECGEVSIDSMGLAWESNGKLFTGILLCKTEETEIRSSYIKGLKHGVESRKDFSFDPVDVEMVHFKHGAAYKRCIETGVGGESYSACHEINCAVENCR